MRKRSRLPIKPIRTARLLLSISSSSLRNMSPDNNARVIDSAEAGYSPISPNRNRILLMGGLVGVAIPAVIFLMIMFLDL